MEGLHSVPKGYDRHQGRSPEPLHQLPQQRCRGEGLFGDETHLSNLSIIHSPPSQKWGAFIGDGINGDGINHLKLRT